MDGRLTRRIVRRIRIPEFQHAWIRIGVARFLVRAYDKPRINPAEEREFKVTY